MGKTFAFIDWQNLYIAIKLLGWSLDFLKLKVYLKEKYDVYKIFLFMGYMPSNINLYLNLQKIGYIIVFKPILKYSNGKTKGNCDAELVLHTMLEYGNYEKAVIVTGDGDFYCLIKYLIDNDKLKKIIIPDQSRYSALLKKFDSGYLAFISDLRNKLSLK